MDQPLSGRSRAEGIIDRSEPTDQMRPGPRTAVVLGAGGVRGLAHIGVLQGLTETGMRPEALIGTSSGAIVAACYAVLGWPPHRMAQEALRMGPGAPFALAVRHEALRRVARLVGLRGGWLSAFLEDLRDVGFEDLKQEVRYFGVTCVDLISGGERFFCSGCLTGRPPLQEAVLGSAALPLLAPSRRVVVDGVPMRLVDGGFSRALPVERAFLPPVGASFVLAVDLQVATGRNERRLDHQERLISRFGGRLMILKPRVRGYGTVLMRRGDPARLIAAGREAVGAGMERWGRRPPAP